MDIPPGPAPKDFRHLLDQVTQMLDTIQQTLEYPPNQSSIVFVQHYNTLLAKTKALVTELTSGNMISNLSATQNNNQRVYQGKWNGLLVSPLLLHPQDPEFYPRVLLRSKLIPEVEMKEAELEVLAVEANVSQNKGALEIDLEKADLMIKHCTEVLTELKEELQMQTNQITNAIKQETTQKIQLKTGKKSVSLGPIQQVFRSKDSGPLHGKNFAVLESTLLFMNNGL